MGGGLDGGRWAMGIIGSIGLIGGCVMAGCFD